jgi:hypothetical protein
MKGRFFGKLGVFFRDDQSQFEEVRNVEDSVSVFFFFAKISINNTIPPVIENRSQVKTTVYISVN